MSANSVASMTPDLPGELRRLGIRPDLSADEAFSLGERYHETEDDGPRAIACYRLSAERGRVAAMHSIAHCHLYGIFVERDYAVAYRWFDEAAKRGCPQAMYHLGLCFTEGYGVPADLAAAAKWYRDSAERGDEDAMCRLAEILKQGKGIKANLAEARRWYRKAADHGQEEANAWVAAHS